jgi:hypothetical protein
MISMDYASDELYTMMMEEAFLGWVPGSRRGESRCIARPVSWSSSGEPMRPGELEHGSYAVLRSRGHSGERLDTRLIGRRFPQWVAQRCPDGYFNPPVGRTESAKVVGKLVEQARASRVEMIEGAGMRARLMRAGRVTGIGRPAGRSARPPVS